MKAARFINLGMGVNDAAWNAWGGLFLGVWDLLYRRKAAQMMVRSGAALMSRSWKE